MWGRRLPIRTYLRDPNARAKVIEQSEAVTARYKAAKDAADAVKDLVKDANAAPPDVKAQVEKIKQDWTEAIGKADATVKQYADLGVPLGWNDERIERAKMYELVWTCKDPKMKEGEGITSLGRTAVRTNGEERYGVRCRPRPASGSIFSSGDCWSGSARPSGTTPSPASPTSATRRAGRRPPMRKRTLPLSPRRPARHSQRRRSMPSGLRTRRNGERQTG